MIKNDNVERTQGKHENVVDKSNDGVMDYIVASTHIHNDIKNSPFNCERPKSAISSIDLQETVLPTRVKKEDIICIATRFGEPNLCVDFYF